MEQTFDRQHSSVISGIRDPACSEKHLQQYWDSISFPQTILSTTGQEITVIGGGILNHNAGPDFLLAELVVGNERRTGDVEMHLAEGDWESHGHAADERYASVILHVVLEKTTKKRETAAGFYPEHTIVLPEIPVEFQRPDPPPAGCQDVPISGAEKTLFELGWQRLQGKSAQCNALCAHSDLKEIWYQKILRTLGYGANHTVMERVWERMDVSLLDELSCHLSVDRLVQFLIGFTGYDAYYQVPVPIWEGLSFRFDLQGFSYYDWHPLQSRPMNHPLFRLAMFFSHYADWLELFETGYGAFSPKQAVTQLQCEMHLPDCLKDRCEFRKIALGMEQAVELLVNCYIPLWMMDSGTRERERLKQWTMQLPGISPYTKIVRFAQSTGWQEWFKDRRVLHPLLLQGFLFLYQHWCEARHCEACPVLRSSP